MRVHPESLDKIGRKVDLKTCEFKPLVTTTKRTRMEERSHWCSRKVDWLRTSKTSTFKVKVKEVSRTGWT